VSTRHGPTAALVALATLAATAGAAAPAAADQAVITATVYPSSAGSVTHPSAGLTALGSCPAYSGPQTVYLWPGGTAYTLPSSSWTLSTVLTCGLGLSLQDVNSVQVATPTLGFEAPLSNADLTDPGQFHDPQAPGALPVVSVDSGAGQNTFTRPWRGGSDDNARDQVTTSGGSPLTIVVYVGGAPLQVTAFAQKLAQTPTTMTSRLSAVVKTAAGGQVGASALSWSWSFGDGSSSTAATPRHTFPAGVSFVTVQVTDTADGSGGTATLQIDATTGSPANGEHGHGGGAHKTHSSSPSGSTGGHHKRGSSTKVKSGGKQTGGASQSSSQTQTTTTSTSTTTSTTAGASTTTTSATASASRRGSASSRRTRHRPAEHLAKASATGAAKRVSGRLISAPDALPVGASPLVTVTPAAVTPATVRQATSPSSLAEAGGGLLVLLLLWAGAAGELRSRRRTRPGG
jgi:PKD domain